MRRPALRDAPLSAVADVAEFTPDRIFASSGENSHRVWRSSRPTDHEYEREAGIYSNRGLDIFFWRTKEQGSDLATPMRTGSRFAGKIFGRPRPVKVRSSVRLRRGGRRR